MLVWEHQLDLYPVREHSNSIAGLSRTKSYLIELESSPLLNESSLTFFCIIRVCTYPVALLCN